MVCFGWYILYTTPSSLIMSVKNRVGRGGLLCGQNLLSITKLSVDDPCLTTHYGHFDKSEILL